MTTSRSFDRAASVYDQTRELPEAAATHGIQSILDVAGPGGRILDVGTGTGRISVPLLERGANLIGIDLSTRMMSLLREKSPTARLALADAAQLPLPASHFDIVLTVHVMHLVGPWREALREFRRVLKPGGAYVNVGVKPEGTHISTLVRNFWRGRVEAYGVNWRLPGVQSHDELRDELLAQGADFNEIEVVPVSRLSVLRDVFEQIANRVPSDTWEIPDDVFATSIKELHDWLVSEYGDLDQSLEEKGHFTLDVARFP